MSIAGLQAGAKVVTGAVRRPRLGPARIALMVVIAVFLIAVLRQVTGAKDLASSGALAAAIGLAVPIGMAGLGGLWSERAGVVNIGLEGMMILGTWGAGFFGFHYGPWAGLLGAMFCGMVGGLIHAIATVVFGVDHIVSGVAINIIGAGAAKYLAARTFTGTPGGGPTQSPTLAPLPTLTVPGLSPALATLEQKQIFFVSDLAGIMGAFVTDLSIVTVIALALVTLTWWVLWRTTFGLRLRSCGESPIAAETLGVNVYRYKFIAVLVSGAMAGLGGGYLALVAANIYRDGQTGGRGFIGLAAMIFGNWHPGGLVGGAALFGYTDAVQLRGGGSTVHAMLLLLAVLVVGIGLWQLLRNHRVIQGAVAITAGAIVAGWFFVSDTVADEFTGMTPYVATLLVLALSSQRLRMPAADGLPYRKGEAG